MFTLQQLLDAGLPATATDGNDSEAVTQFERELTQTEWLTYLRISDPDKGKLKKEYLATLTQLQNIEDAASPNNAQVITAVKFMAKTLGLILKLLARMI
jgi:hypothetical protein